MLTLLTPTGARPEAWALCERWMAAQTYAGPVRWIVVDDGPDAQPITFSRPGWELTVVRPEPYWVRGQNTQARNLLAGLALVPKDARLLVIEDDDFYSPHWLQVCDQELNCVDLYGEGRARYYSLRKRAGRQLVNLRHASLCSSAMKGPALVTLRRVAQARVKFIDIVLWSEATSKLVGIGQNVVGMKGLPGRGGIGIGHDEAFQGCRDVSGDLLRAWVGEEAAALYVRFCMAGAPLSAERRENSATTHRSARV